MFHFNCENDDFDNFAANLDRFGARLRRRCSKARVGQPRRRAVFHEGRLSAGRSSAALLKEFGERFGVQIYLEPGEAAITRSAELVTTVLDIVRNEIDIAIVDASTEAHMLDLLIYRQPARRSRGPPPRPGIAHTIAGRSCLAGDIFGTYRFRTAAASRQRPCALPTPAGYTMVKKNWFNGLPMPAIAVRRLDGSVETGPQFRLRGLSRESVIEERAAMHEKECSDYRRRRRRPRRGAQGGA